MSLSRREQVLGTVTLLALLFGGVGFTARKQLDLWREKGARVDELRRLRATERELVEMGPLWRERYEKVRDQMPVFEPGRQVDTHWMSRMDALADTHGVRILRRQVGREELVGDVYEFSIECREWEGTLEAFIRFLHAMQAEGAMLDVRDLLVRPHPSAKGMLRGSFTLFCAYMRGVPAPGGEEPSAASVPTVEAEAPAPSEAVPAPSPVPEEPSASPPESPGTTPEA